VKLSEKYPSFELVLNFVKNDAVSVDMVHSILQRHTFHLKFLAFTGVVEDAVDSPHLDRYGPQTHGEANVLSPGSYLVWGITRPIIIQAGWFLPLIKFISLFNCNSLETIHRKVTHMAVDGLIQCHSSRDNKKIGSSV